MEHVAGLGDDVLVAGDKGQILVVAGGGGIGRRVLQVDLGRVRARGGRRLAVVAMIDDGADGNARQQAFQSANVIDVVMGDQQRIDFLQPQGMGGIGDAFGTGMVAGDLADFGVAGVNQQRLAIRGDKKCAAATFHVNRDHLQGVVFRDRGRGGKKGGNRKGFQSVAQHFVSQIFFPSLELLRRRR